jgi:hypothetical protein
MFRDVAQLVAYASGGRVVASSSLVIPTKPLNKTNISTDVGLFFFQKTEAGSRDICHNILSFAK